MSNAPATLNEIFLGAAERYAGRPAAFRARRNGSWVDITYAAFKERVHDIVGALATLDLAPGDRVAILSENCPEWAITDYACLAARLVDVPIYPTLTAHQTAYILKDSGAKAIFVSDAAHLEMILSVRGDLPDLRTIVVFEETGVRDGAIAFAALESRGRERRAALGDWESVARTVKPGDLATLIYTSGTTGEPKGVMLTHGNITSNVVAALEVFDMNTTDSCLSFLPLCHSFERMVGHYTMLQAGAVINYATSVDSVSREIGEVNPTILASVPRLYEKIFAAVSAKAANSGKLSRLIFAWAREVGGARLDAILAGRRVSIFTKIAYRIADMLVYSKLRDRLGGKIRFMVSGGAPLSPDICRFFLGAGITIYEGYGLTETSPVISANSPRMLKPGTVGRPIPGVEIRIADDGEILARGPNIMLGYYHKPEVTAEAIDKDGWFHTGDIGEIDADGCLRITDRKKDLLKTSGGKYVAPQPIENMLKTNRYVLNAVLLGDRRKFPVMLMVPNFAALEPWLKENQIADAPPASLLADARVREKLEREARKSLRDLAQFETPKKFLMLPNDFTVESGELTPTLKVKRKVVEQHYAEQIEALYGGS